MSVASWLAELYEPARVEPVDGAHIDELRSELERIASRSVALLEEATGRSAEPAALRVPKSRLAALERCERNALEAATLDDGPAAIGTAGLRGIAYDRFVIHQIHGGRVLDPVEDLRAMLVAEGAWEELSTLDDLESSSPDAASGLLDPVAAVVADGWSGIDPEWAPRTQSRVTVAFSDARVVCSGLVDVEFGGTSTGRPWVVVEVKSGAARQEHLAEVGLYALLLALRDRRAPVHVARWYPGAAPADLAVTGGVLESAARRLGAGIARWSELLAGDDASETPGAWCRWCPVADRCSSALRQGERTDDP